MTNVGERTGDALDSRLSLYDKAINALAEAKSHVRNSVKGLAGRVAGGWHRGAEQSRSEIKKQLNFNTMIRTCNVLEAVICGRGWVGAGWHSVIVAARRCRGRS